MATRLDGGLRGRAGAASAACGRRELQPPRELDELGAQARKLVELPRGYAHGDHRARGGDQRLAREAVAARPRGEDLADHVDELLHNLSPARDRARAGRVDVDQEDAGGGPFGAEHVEVGAQRAVVAGERLGGLAGDRVDHRVADGVDDEVERGQEAVLLVGEVLVEGLAQTPAPATTSATAMRV